MVWLICKVYHGYLLVTCTCMQNKTQLYIFSLILLNIHLLKMYDMIQAVGFLRVHYRTIYLRPSETQFEPRREKTNVLISDLFPHKSGCTPTEVG